MLGENLLIWFTILINLLSSVIEEADFIAKITVASLGQGDTITIDTITIDNMSQKSNPWSGKLNICLIALKWYCKIYKVFNF